MIEIREAEFVDVPAMREVAVQIYVDTFGGVNTRENMEAFLSDSYSLSDFEREFYEPGSALYLAWEAQRIVGFLRMRESFEVAALLGSNTVELHRLYVLKNFQNQKVGKVLMEIAIGYALEKKYEWVWLGVWEKNFKAQQFYTKWGFEKFSEHVFQMGDDPQVDWLMKKRL